MSEWGVVLVIVTLIGLIASIMGPVVYVTRTLAKLTAVTGRMQADQTNDRNQNMQSHEKLWKHISEQDERINDHETRIQILEIGETG